MKRYGSPEFIVTDRLRSYKAAVHSSVYNLFNLERHFYSRENFKHPQAERQFSVRWRDAKINTRDWLAAL